MAVLRPIGRVARAAWRYAIAQRLALFLGLQYALLWSIWRTRGGFGLLPLFVLTPVLVGFCLLLSLPRRTTGAPWLTLFFGVGFALASLGHLVFTEPLIWRPHYDTLSRSLAAVLALAVLVAGWLAPRRRTARILIVAAAVMFGIYLAGQLLRSPHPVMDVWSISTEAADSLLAGVNPYARTYSDVYQRGGFPAYGYEMEFIWLPGTLLHAALPRLLGLDMRWASVVALAAGLYLFAWTARKEPGDGRAPAGAIAAMAATAVFWFDSGQPFMVEQAWAEPFLLVYLCLALWAWRRCEWLTALALVLALSVKQTAWFCVPFLGALAVRERRWRLLACVAVGVAIVVGPFFIWDPAAFVRNTALVLLEKAPRGDGLTWAAFCLRYSPGCYGLVTRAGYLAYAVAFGGLVVRLWGRARRDPLLETQRWMALGLFAFFLLLKQSFYNYYWLVAGLLAFQLCMAAEKGSSRNASCSGPSGEFVCTCDRGGAAPQGD